MDHIELNTFLRIKGLASSGGKAKFLIRNNGVKVDGQIETRNRRKLLAGTKVECLGKVLLVSPSDLIPPKRPQPKLFKAIIRTPEDGRKESS